MKKSVIGLSLDKILEQLRGEYSNWRNYSSFTHCYCPVVNLFRNYDLRLKQGYDSTHWTPTVDPNLDVHVCGLNIIPPVGNLHEYGFEELFELAFGNRTYEKIADEGPHGLAREITDWPEHEIMERFLERTPCGMCDDLVSEGYIPATRKANTPSFLDSMKGFAGKLFG